MSRINTNIESLVATRVLHQNNAALSLSLQRLSTGLRINTGVDDPAGLIASENLRSAKGAISAAIDNANRANNVVGIAEGGLQEVSSLLLELENLVDRSANDGALSADELQANQLQIDAILQSINRIADTTEFGGRKLLNGSFDFTVSGTTQSDQYISAIAINAAKIPANATRTVTVQVLQASEFAYISALGPGLGGALTSATSIQVRGNYGAEILSFASGSTAAAIVAAVNQSTALTGVSAVLSGPGGAIIFTSTGFGSEALASVTVLQGRLTTNKNDDTGVDGTVTVNGTTAGVRGLEVSVRSGSLAVDLVLAQNFARKKTATDNAAFTIVGGGATFAISPTIGLVGQESLGIKAVSTGSLGLSTIGYLSSLGSGQTNAIDRKNFANAQRIIREASNQVASLRGRIGAFQSNTLASTVNALQVAFENTTAAESAIRDADFAVETSALTRAQILVQASTTALQLANAAPQNVLALLG